MGRLLAWAFWLTIKWGFIAILALAIWAHWGG